MSVYPPALVTAARNLLESEDFKTLLTSRLDDLQAAITDSSEDKEILKAHAEYTTIREFAEWIAMLSNVNPKR